MRVLSLLVLACGMLSVEPAAAANLRYGFHGTVTFSVTSAYGIPTPVNTLVDGEFKYNPAAAMTHTVSNAKGYQQDIPNGFFATFGSTLVRADKYLVLVADNLVQSGTPKDVFSIHFATNLNPTLSAPLNVAGVDRSAGLFKVEFPGSSGLWSGTGLPSSIDPAQFPAGTGLFADTATGLVDAIFSVTELFVIVPEPSSMVLVAMGMSCLVLCAKKRKPRKGC